jgi:hypothetical protein
MRDNNGNRNSAPMNSIFRNDAKKYRGLGKNFPPRSKRSNKCSQSAVAVTEWPFSRKGSK